MKKYDVFVKSLTVLINADREQSTTDEIYRMGVIAQFNLTFELACEAVKETLIFHGVDMSIKDSSRDILKTAYAINLLSDENIWLDMLKKRYHFIHVYDETSNIELVNAIFDDYIKAFVNLKDLYIKCNR